jgi:hypothetical protein
MAISTVELSGSITVSEPKNLVISSKDLSHLVLGPQAAPRPSSLAPSDVRVSDIDMACACHLIDETVTSLGEIQDVKDLIIYNDKNNSSCRLTKTQIDTLKGIFNDFNARGLIGDPKSLKHSDILRINEALISRLTEMGENPFEYALVANAETVSHDNFCETYLQNLQNGDSIRILEPGNNDQTTPIILASQINKIKTFCESKGLTNIKIEVLVMGKGGHATTAVFPQIGIMKGAEFSGVEEAISLSSTLTDALEQQGIEYRTLSMSEPFGKQESSGFQVEIKLEKGSTNTGQNVSASRNAWEKSNTNTTYFIAAATTANHRQALTFAHQIGIDFKEMVTIPMPRSEKVVISGFDDHTAVTELYAGLAERCRSFLYMYLQNGQKENFIPLSIADTHNLENLYDTYAKLSGKSLKDAYQTTMQEMMTFFGGKYQTMEKSIALNTSLDGHLEKTRAAVRKLSSKIHGIRCITEVLIGRIKEGRKATK